MKHYRISAQFHEVGDHGFEESEPLAQEVGQALLDAGVGYGGDMAAIGHTLSISFYVKGDQLDEGLEAVRTGLRQHPRQWSLLPPEEIPAGTLYENVFRNSWLCMDCHSIDDFIHAYEQQAQRLKEWKAAGIRLDHLEEVAEDEDYFVTDNFDVAMQYGFTPRMDEARTVRTGAAAEQLPPV